MVMLKISSFLAVYALVVCQMDSFQAAPVRPGLESITDRVTLSDYEARRLLNALVKEFIQMTAEELEQASEGNSLDRPISKRCASLSTCVLGKLSQELHKLQTYPRTDVGAGTPGKKRNQCNSTEEGLQHSHLCDPPPGRLPEQVRGSGQEQLHPHQRGLQGLWQTEKKRPEIGNGKLSGDVD
ncbi:Calcitonin, partial [Lamprotornis superbus]